MAQKRAAELFFAAGVSKKRHSRHGGVHSAQTRTRLPATYMHVGERANTKIRDPGPNQLYYQSTTHST